MHNEVKRFELTGTVSDRKLMQTRERLIQEVESSMRDEGYVPMLELNPQFTREFDPVAEKYNFVLSVYGAYVGEEAWQPLGMANGILEERYSHPLRSSLS